MLLFTRLAEVAPQVRIQDIPAILFRQGCGQLHILTRSINDRATIDSPAITAVVSITGCVTIDPVVISSPATVVTATVAVSATTAIIVTATIVDVTVVTTTVLHLVPACIERSRRTPSSVGAVTPNRPRLTIRQLMA